MSAAPRMGRGAWLLGAALATAGVLAGAQAAAQSGAPAPPPVLEPLSTAVQSASAWQRSGLPRQSLPWTRFSVVSMAGESVLQVDADGSYGNLLHPVAAADAQRHQLAWRWRVEQGNPAADLRSKQGDDTPIKVCALFDMPLSAVPFFERQLLRIARDRTGEALPAATLCYVWDAHLAPGTLVVNAYTGRLRMIVLRGPQDALQQWHSERRDLAADFLRAFGQESASVPPLLAIGVGADADNTRARSRAQVDGLSLQ